MKITLIGGAGHMGQVFVNALHAHEVQVFGHGDWHDADACEQLKQAGWVIVTVPIAVTCDVIQQAAQHINPDALLSDFTSIKHVPIQAMLEHHAGPVAGLHPMFGPNVQSLTDLNMVVCKTDRTPGFDVSALWRNLGLHVVELTPEQHDDLTTWVQAAHYLVLYARAVAAKKLGLDAGVYMDNTRAQDMRRFLSEDACLYQGIIFADAVRVQALKAFTHDMLNMPGDDILVREAAALEPKLENHDLIEALATPSFQTKLAAMDALASAPHQDDAAFVQAVLEVMHHTLVQGRLDASVFV
jgi:prephenate dehydrogenase